MSYERIAVSVCSYCGKEFVPAPEHAYKTHNAIYCSWKCSNAAFNERQKILQERKEKRQKDRAERQEIKNQVGKLQTIKFKKVILQYTKDGDFVAKYWSLKEAAESVCGSISAISRCCSGELKQSSGYVWRYAKETVVTDTNDGRKESEEKHEKQTMPDKKALL